MTAWNGYPELAGRSAVVTGAARGMGLCFVQGLVAQGVHVVAADIDTETLQSSVDQINATVADELRVVPVALDVSRPEDHLAAASLAVERFGRLDCWVNNAGVFPQADVADITAEQLTTTMAVNLNGVLFGTQAAAQAMGASGGSIVNMGSVAGLRVRPGRAAYSASKAAVIHLTRSLAIELGGAGIRVNAVAPGFVDTEMVRWVHETPGALDRALDGIPLGRLGQPEDVFDAVSFLLSDRSSYITGSVLVIDGGSSHGGRGLTR